MAKALLVNIFKHGTYDCSNHGISERFNEILLLTENGFIDVDATEENLCKLDSITFGDRTHYFVRPVTEPKEIGWMSGGTVVWTSDSRFPFEYPLQLHDREETQKQYDSYSR